MLSATSAANSLQDLQARPLVRFIKTYARTIAIVLAIAAVAVAMIAHVLGYGVKHRHAEKPPAAAPVAKVPAPATRPWVDEPMPSQAIDVCHRAWSAQRLERKGWSAASWSCAISQDGVATNTSWSRTYGLASDAPGTLSPAGQSSIDSKAIAATFHSSPDVVTSSDVAVRAIRDFAQIHGYTATIGTDAGKPTLPGASVGNDTRLWTTSNVTLNVPWAPWLGLAPSFDSVSGLRIRTVTWNSQADQWVVAGELYGLTTPGAEPHASTAPRTFRKPQSQTKQVPHENS
jgi:hypothetical protein